MFEPPLFLSGPAIAPGTVISMQNKSDVPLSSWSSQPSWETTPKESTAKIMRVVINPMQGISNA